MGFATPDASSFDWMIPQLADSMAASGAAPPPIGQTLERTDQPPGTSFNQMPTTISPSGAPAMVPGFATGNIPQNLSGFNPGGAPPAPLPNPQPVIPPSVAALSPGINPGMTPGVDPSLVGPYGTPANFGAPTTSISPTGQPTFAPLKMAAPLPNPQPGGAATLGELVPSGTPQGPSGAAVKTPGAPTAAQGSAIANALKYMAPPKGPEVQKVSTPRAPTSHSLGQSRIMEILKQIGDPNAAPVRLPPSLGQLLGRG